jgi:hypothetical protein
MMNYSNFPFLKGGASRINWPATVRTILRFWHPRTGLKAFLLPLSRTGAGCCSTAGTSIKRGLEKASIVALTRKLGIQLWNVLRDQIEFDRLLLLWRTKNGRRPHGVLSLAKSSALEISRTYVRKCNNVTRPKIL